MMGDSMLKSRRYRVYPYEKLLQKYGSDAAVKSAAGRTNGSLNRLGALGFLGGMTQSSECGCFR